jgi:hypothetical protein
MTEKQQLVHIDFMLSSSDENNVKTTPMNEISSSVVPIKERERERNKQKSRECMFEEDSLVFISRYD